MSPQLPVVTGKQVASVALKAGFRLDRQKGSHAVFVREHDQSRIVIPMHTGKTIKPKTLTSIMQDMGLTVEEFRAML